MDYANLIIIAYEFTYTCLNCVNLSADDLLVLGSVQSLRLSTPLGPLCSLPQPCRRYGFPEVSALPTADASPTLCVAIVSSTRCRCPPTSAPTKNHRLVGRSKPRPYSAYFQHNTRIRHHSVVGSRLGATGQACGSQLGYRQDASSPLLPLVNVKMQAWRACGTRLTPP